ncbi:NAD dependent epimerase/dehydratase [Aspergillus brunneoviolaceus CBS 621.78]|uniref:NAD dependent epimerase/dehydratase n=1 Tax=Aspergillus brunneoviolaceus CBS 621.78 TaxID=1450534 RepID=A0ACD1GMQ1_9EURO|nr:NAD dependent epimerase/dehydratase [Aspergillus brunneoviolaceus CBS 621.78]RAH50513.1 NAD dependent epimerase/dehydratase [Aspergillus brunneoviolaceus CBS 621.78]
MSQVIVFVSGATGQQGGATARELVTAGVQVHALARDPSSESAVELQHLGVRLFPGDYDNLSALKAAMEGATAVFLNVSPMLSDLRGEVVHAKNILNAAIASGTVTSIVYSSVAMTGQHESFPNWGPEYPPRWYWENKADIEAMLVQQKAFRTAYRPETAMTVLAAEDVGRFAAAALTDPRAYHTHEIDLGGEEIQLEFYSEEEAKALAERDPRLYAQLWTNEVGYQVDFTALEKYPIRLTRFADYLDKHRDEVRAMFK